MNYSRRNIPPKGSPEYILMRYNAARSNLVVAIGFTIINIVLYLVGDGTMFLFSIFLPYMFVGPDVVLTVVGVLLLGVYVLCWFKSKENPKWLTVAFVLFIIDTIAFVLLNLLVIAAEGLISFSIVIDLAFHAWLLVSLASGVKNGRHFEYAKEELENDEYEEPADVQSDEYEEPVSTQSDAEQE